MPKALEVGLAAVGEKLLSRLMIHFSGFFRVDRQLDRVHSSRSSAMAGVTGTMTSRPATASRQASMRGICASGGVVERAGEKPVAAPFSRRDDRLVRNQ